MSLTAISSLESARRKFFMISSQNMCKNLESHVLWAQEAEMSLTAISLFESARSKIFHELTAEHV